MPVTLTIENAPDDLVDVLLERAFANHRSIEGEVLAIIEASVHPKGRPTVSAVTRARAFDGPGPEHAPADIDAIIAKIRKLDLRSPSESTAMIREDRDSR